MTDISSGKERIKNFSIIFFAFVGFIASVVTIIQFFTPTETSKLNIDAQYNSFRVPLYVGENLYKDSPARQFAKSTKEAFCKNVDVPDLESKNDQELKKLKLPKNKEESASICRQAIDMEFAARWSGAYSDGYSTLYEYTIKNDGTRVASDIRLDGTDVFAAQYARGKKFVDIRKTEGEPYYDLPDLNPQEKIDLLIWSNDYHIIDQYTDHDDLPAVTYAGSKVEFNLRKRVDERWYGIFEFFDDFPIVISIAIAVAISFMVVLGIILVISILDALITGKPLSSIFKAKNETEETTAT